MLINDTIPYYDSPLLVINDPIHYYDSPLLYILGIVLPVSENASYCLRMYNKKLLFLKL
jgi:hypothetical protein